MKIGAHNWNMMSARFVRRTEKVAGQNVRQLKILISRLVKNPVDNFKLDVIFEIMKGISLMFILSLYDTLLTFSFNTSYLWSYRWFAIGRHLG